MQWGSALETAIGLAFTFGLIALLCSAIVEAVSNLFKKRAKHLLRGLREMLDIQAAPTAATSWWRSALELVKGPFDTSADENQLNAAALNAKPTTPPAGVSALATESSRQAAAGVLHRLEQDPAKVAGAQLVVDALKHNPGEVARRVEEAASEMWDAAQAVAEAAAKEADAKADGALEVVQRAEAEKKAAETAAKEADAKADGAREAYEAANTAGTVPAEAAAWLIGQPLMRSLRTTSFFGRPRNPSYVPAGVFARALVDAVVPDSQGVTTIDKIEASVSKMREDSPIRKAILGLLKTAESDVTKLRKGLEQWYNATMDRVEGAYKRWAQVWLLGVSLVIACLLNVDSIAIAKTLYTDDSVRSVAVAAATSGALCPSEDPKQKTECVNNALKNLQAGGLPLWWNDLDQKKVTGAGTFSSEWWLLKVLGLALTAAAATFGAPFWFDLLNRLASLRTAGNKPKETTT